MELLQHPCDTRAGKICKTLENNFHDRENINNQTLRCDSMRAECKLYLAHLRVLVLLKMPLDFNNEPIIRMY